MPNVSFILKTRTKHSDLVIFGLSHYGMSDTYLFMMAERQSIGFTSTLPMMHTTTVELDNT